METTANMKIAMTAINKWFFYAMNYPVVKVAMDDEGTAVYLPDFFNAFPLWIRQHFAAKWQHGYDEHGAYAALMYFYGQLDGGYRKMLMDYILTHYDEEQHLTFKDEE